MEEEEKEEKMKKKAHLPDVHNEPDYCFSSIFSSEMACPGLTPARCCVELQVRGIIKSYNTSVFWPRPPP